ncbi:MAG: hypothetical protein WCL21_15645 [Mariniphaga sp.]
MHKQLVIFYFFLIFNGLHAQDVSVISLAGSWRFAPDPVSAGLTEKWFSRELPTAKQLYPHGAEMLTNDWINLPGSPDESKIGKLLIPLSSIKKEDEKVKRYEGPYWVQRSIALPDGWAEKALFLAIGKLPNGSKIYWDFKLIGEFKENNTPDKFELTKPFNSIGNHLITVFINKPDDKNGNRISRIDLSNGEQKISLSGKWRIALDVWDRGGESSWYNSGWQKRVLPLAKELHAYYATFFRCADFTIHDWITLPGSPAEANIGTNLTPSRAITPGLERFIEYDGPFWVQRSATIPKDWAGKTVGFSMERVPGVSILYWDGELIGESHGYDVPQKFEIKPTFTTPGNHNITIYTSKLDIKYPQGGHGLSSENGVGWNGIIGRIELRTEGDYCLNDVQVYPNIQNNSVKVALKIKENSRQNNDLSITFFIRNKNEGTPFEKIKSITLKRGALEIPVEELILKHKAFLWSEFSPTLYELKTVLTTGVMEDISLVTFGMREFTTLGKNFLMNGKKIFLRGAQQDGSAPIENYVPMGRDYWLRIMKISREYGLNHLRCHTWCPPEAAFAAADEVGIILQIELPSYGPNYKELNRIIDTYGNHPSFCLLALGNELFNHDDASKKAVNGARLHDPRHLYTCTSHPYSPGCDDDFFVSAWGWRDDSIVDNYPKKVNAGGNPIVGIVWGGGDVSTKTRFNMQIPATQMDYRNEIKKSPIPVISHEVGQWAMFPDLSILEKYTGTLRNTNYERIKLKLESRGMLEQAQDFAMASGKFSALLYKEEIESALRTPNLGGFNLLGINDFEGQNLAVVGILDEFWDSKNILTPNKHHQYCGPIVPLVRMTKRVWNQNEILDVSVELAHYGENDLLKAQPLWHISNAKGAIIQQGKFKQQDLIQGGLRNLGTISQSLIGVSIAQKLTLTVEIQNSKIKNSWEFWVYPTEINVQPEKIKIFNSWGNNIKEALNAGERVLLIPDLGSLKDGYRESCFTTVFWNSIFKRMQRAHTMGILCNPSHPIFKDFPTDSYSNWQWWDIAMNANAMYLNNFPVKMKPLVQVIDTYAINDKLAYVWECKVSKGSLLVSTINFSKNMEQRPASKQLYKSLTDYMNGKDFNPENELTSAFIDGIFSN